MSAATTQFPTATILAYPRIGRGRELKRALEARWAGRITEAELIQAANDLRKENLARLVELGLNPSDASLADAPSLYDHVLTPRSSWVPSRRASPAARASTSTSRSPAVTTRSAPKR